MAKEYALPSDFKPKIIVDCGGNVGLSAVYYANKYPLAKIIVIEPDENNFSYLLKNIKQYPNVTGIKRAVWSHETHLKILDIGNGNWALKTVLSHNSEENSTHAVTIENIMNQFQINIIDVLKIDVEGAEKEIFSTSDNWINKVRFISIELHDQTDKNVSKPFYDSINKVKHKIYQQGENVMCDFR
jgi:FkbM family methyltransferase